jgi:hypothetical protein
MGSQSSDGGSGGGAVMTRRFRVHIRRTWDERYAITVEAASVEEAMHKAYTEKDGEEFNWNNVEYKEREVMFIDDAQTGEELYSLDDDTQEVNNTIATNVSQ